MTNAPNPGNEPEPTPGNEPEQPTTPQVRQRPRRHLVLALSILLLACLGGGITWLWFFVYRQLAPQVETTVTKLLNRPIKLGAVESVSLNGLRFGASSLPATATDPDRASVEAVDVTFNLVPLLTDRTLPLDVTLVKPKVYIEQAQDGKWFDLKIQKLPKGAIDIKLQVLRIRDANVSLVPRGAGGNSRQPVALFLPSGKARFLNDNKLIKFDVGGQLLGGGNLTLNGENRPGTGEIKAAILGNDLSAPEVGRLIQLPLLLQAGAVDGNLEVTSRPQKPLTFLGTAGLKNVTAQLNPLPKPFAKTNGQLRFQGTQVRLENVNTLFGQIPAQANGTVDTQAGFNLVAQTQPIQLPQVLQTFNIKTLPVPAAAEVKAELQVVGTPSKPVVSGKFVTTKVAQLDKVKFRAISAGFGVVDSILSVNNLRALPTLGGLVTGNGEVQLGQKGSGVKFNFQGNNLPGDALALTYNIKPPVPIGLVSGNTQIIGSLNNAQNIRATGSANLNVAGGTVAVRDIQVAGKRFTAQVQASGVQVGRLAQVPPSFRVPVSGNISLSGPLTGLSAATIQGSGSGSLNIGGGTVRATSIQLANGRFSAQVKASGVQVGSLAQVPSQVQGPVSGNFTLSGPLTEFSTAKVQGSGSGSLNVAGGTVTATNIQVANDRFTAKVQASGVQVQRLAQVPPQVRGPLSGNFSLSGPLTEFSTAKVQGSGSGTLNVAGGTVKATSIQLAQGRFTAQVQASGVEVERLAQVPPQVRGPLSGNFNVAGALANLSPSTIQASGSGRLNVAGGTVNATSFQLADGRFQAVVEPNGVQLAGFSPQLKGRLGGRLNVGGSVTALSPSAIQATGQVNFSEGIALIDRPLTASIAWNGQQLQIQQASAEGFSANGVVEVNLKNQGLQAIRALNLNVQARDLDLQRLPVTLPNAVKVAGRADFAGTIAGTPTAPNVNGNLQLRNFAAAGLTFDPLLSGQVTAQAGQGVNLQLAGNTDRIQVALNSDYRPVSFDIKRGEAIARGTRQGEQLLVSTQNFPISLMKSVTPLPAAIASQPLDGRLSGDLAVNLNTYGVSGTVAIANPVIGTLRGDSFTGTLQYANGVVALNNGKFQQGKNEYLISANLNQTSNGPQFQAKLDVPKGDIQSVLTALQIFDISDLSRGFKAPTYGRATNVAEVAAGLPQSPLQTQLRRLAEIDALLQQQQDRADAAPLPPLTQAKGEFSGTVTVTGSLASGINADFNVKGQNWQWGPYSANEVIAEGKFQNGVLSLLPLRFQSGESYANFSGTIGGETQSGQLQLTNIPIEQLQAVLSRVSNVPPNLVGLTGYLNATATLSGSIKNPQARGVVSLTDATLNRTKVQAAQGSFSYSNARLNFGSTVQLANATNPLAIGGTIPYKLPVATVAPTDNKLALNINVQNDGLALLNLFTGGQVSWVSGTGDVQLNISGTVDPQTNRPTQLLAQGTATVDQATIQASALPQPLTNVTGKILFDFDDIRVDTVTAQFGGGTITAAGNIPIYKEASQENPLKVDIGELAINLKGLYKGRVQGDVLISGTALSPKIGGQLNLFNGQVSLADPTAATGVGGGGEGGNSTPASTGTTDGSTVAVSTSTPTGDSSSTSRFEFNDLKLKLDKNIQITKAPILSFLADGTLTLNGPLGGLRPEGTIYLKRGQVNLFTTQFRLTRSRNNTARFVPSQGLDPILNVRLIASVAEATQRRLPTDPLSAEIQDVPSTAALGNVQTVRILAKATGPASQLADHLELTSTPARSKAEIVALLGGSFVDTLGRGDTTLGLVNLAGSVLLNNVQNIIGDALGLSEFRLYPTTITNDKNRRNSTLGLSAEAGVDIGNRLSVSVSKELTTDQPAQYGLRYRLNNKTILRGSTDLSGDSRAEVQYQTQF